jgi:uncharacterized protein YuzE
MTKTNYSYDKESNAAYIKLESVKIVDSEEIQPNVVFDYDDSDRVVGIELLNVKQAFPRLLLSENDAQKFVEIMHNPPKPSSALVALMNKLK